jgi:hypothetical protein
MRFAPEAAPKIAAREVVQALRYLIRGSDRRARAIEHHLIDMEAPAALVPWFTNGCDGIHCSRDCKASSSSGLVVIAHKSRRRTVGGCDDCTL